MVNRFTFLGLVCALAVFGLGLLVFALADSSGNAPTVEAAATTPPSPPPAAAPEEPTATATATATPTATAEPKGITRLQRAAKAAGCTLQSPPNEGAEHVDRQTTVADYGSNPPTSGIHHPIYAEDGIYPTERTPGLAHTVHALEHGRVNVQYSQAASPATVDELTRFVSGSDGGYHTLLFHNQTDMPFEVAATAWDQLIGCKTFNGKTVEALAEFRSAYLDKGPETVP